MFNAFHPIDDRVLMRVLSIAIIMCMCVRMVLVFICFSIYFEQGSEREREEKKL